MSGAMTDYAELKKLAEAVGEEWIKCDRGDYGDYDGNCNVLLNKEYDRRIAIFFDELDADYSTAANPQTVLELLAQNASLKAEVERMIPVGDSDPQYYLGAIMRRLQEYQKVIDAGPNSFGLGDEALADEIDWIDCFMDAEKRKRAALYEEAESLRTALQEAREALEPFANQAKWAEELIENKGFRKAAIGGHCYTYDDLRLAREVQGG